MDNSPNIQQRHCSWKGCTKPFYSLSFCILHYRRFVRHGDPDYTKKPRLSFERPEELKAVLFSRRRIDTNGCWLWTLQPNNPGYAEIKIDKQRREVHRVSAALFLDFDINDPLFILHSCDVKKCFNPEHLRPGTQQDNMNDKVSKNRQPRGETNGTSKLTESVVRAIREYLLHGMTQQDLARQYGVSQATVQRIAYGKSWKHINPEKAIGSRSNAWKRAIIDVLKDNQGPMKFQALCAEIKRRGYPFTWSGIYKYLSPMCADPYSPVVKVKYGHYQYQEKPSTSPQPPATPEGATGKS